MRRRVSISKGGGAYPHWRGDGKQLFYDTLDGQVMAVDLTADKTFQAGLPRSLFGVQTVLTSNFDVTVDGKLFLFATQQGASTPRRLTVVLNWRAGLKKQRLEPDSGEQDPRPQRLESKLASSRLAQSVTLIGRRYPGSEEKTE